MRILLALALALIPTLASAQCNGVFSAHTVCGNSTASPGIPGMIPQSAVTGIPGGTNGQVQYNNAGAFGGLTTAQLTALVNSFTTSLSGAVPASGGSSTAVFLNQAGAWTPALSIFPVMAPAFGGSK